MHNKPTESQKDMKKGVYTAGCQRCGQTTYMHLDGAGTFDPLKCRSCKATFVGIGRGERKNEYIGLVSDDNREDNKADRLKEETSRAETKIRINTSKNSSYKKSGNKINWNSKY